MSEMNKSVRGVTRAYGGVEVGAALGRRGHAEADVAGLAPGGAPRVPHQPVVTVLRVLAVTDQLRVVRVSCRVVSCVSRRANDRTRARLG